MSLNLSPEERLRYHILANSTIACEQVIMATDFMLIPIGVQGVSYAAYGDGTFVVECIGAGDVLTIWTFDSMDAEFNTRMSFWKRAQLSFAMHCPNDENPFLQPIAPYV